ncbi:hypothetical protein GKQ23_08110 [Erwinia sp. E602]|uniref:hypothetical protein n=1 Tax=Erwinia sp. E602 TaxID=2675378 RepID=UPI001BAC307F|nr:hypothetical protein [Erwinia sp. E602]QUG74955.1 hypothetical protein GKQ23_08110 [Erwinia sp. E602]
MQINGLRLGVQAGTGAIFAGFFNGNDYLNRPCKSLRKRFLFLLEFAPNWIPGVITGSVHGLDR